MFESLDDQMKHDAKEASSAKEKYMKWALVAVVVIVVIGGVLVGVQMPEY